MKRRIVKKKIRGLAYELIVPARKYADATPRATRM
jgi:hypothetical protein